MANKPVHFSESEFEEFVKKAGIKNPSPKPVPAKKPESSSVNTSASRKASRKKAFTQARMSVKMERLLSERAEQKREIREQGRIEREREREHRRRAAAMRRNVAADRRETRQTVSAVQGGIASSFGRAQGRPTLRPDKPVNPIGRRLPTARPNGLPSFPRVASPPPMRTPGSRGPAMPNFMAGPALPDFMKPKKKVR